MKQWNTNSFLTYNTNNDTRLLAFSVLHFQEDGLRINKKVCGVRNSIGKPVLKLDFTAHGMSLSKFGANAIPSDSEILENF